jgi:signal transduction histidine kinase
MNGVVRGGQVAFTPKARLLKLIGGELIRDDVMALVELVKNSHDADARKIRVLFRGATAIDGEIVVEDDGTGMSVDELLHHWMQPAGSSKRDPSARRTPAGRRVLGEKGVGRFAVDRLGSRCELISRKPGSPTEVFARFNWDDFDCETAFLSEVMSQWEERAPDTIQGHGTVIRISGLRQPWSNRSFRRLTSRIQRLLSPFSRDDTFAVEIQSDDLPDYSDELQRPYFEKAPYRLSARFDGCETITYEFNGETHETTWPGPGTLNCGPVAMRIGIFDLETEALKRIGHVYDVRAWLREWSGVSIYRDGFRVLPYGEPDDDWLRLDQRRVNNPVQRLSNNQICAMIEISGDSNAELRDQTNRGGLIQNQAFEDLRRLVLHVVELGEAGRQAIRNPREPAHDGASERDDAQSVSSILKSLRQHAGSISRKSGFRLVPVIDQLSDSYRREKRELEQAIEAHTELSALGHNASFVMASLAPHLNSLDRELEELGREKIVGTAHLLNLQRQVLEMRDGLKLLAPLSASISENVREIDLAQEVRSFSETAAAFATHEGAKIEHQVPAELILIDGRRSHLWQILTILLRNSLQAMTRTDGKVIRIRVTRSSKTRTARIIFKNKGHGIPESEKEMIFNPGHTSRRGAQGMGLTIARNLVSSMNGKLEVDRNDGRSDRTTMRMSFPLSRRS